MRIIALVCCALAWTSPASSQTPLPLGDPQWTLTGDGTKREAIGGRDTVAIENGLAYRRDVRLLDGTVDFDVQLTPRRSFVYLQFRMASDREHEEIYLRAHKPNLPDALQYAPVFNGISGWQLFHGPGSTAPCPFSYATWTHVRLVVKGTEAALFVGDMAKPALVMPRLARAAAPGYIALRVFTADPVPGPPTRFSNVVVQPGHVPFDFSSVTVPDPTEPARIREWRVSEPYVPAENEPVAFPADRFGDGSKIVTAEPSGLVLLNKFLEAPGGSRRVGVIARVTIRAQQAGVHRLDLGYSDIATVFVNGQPVFRGDAHYSYDAPRQEGLIGFDQAALFLPLHAGDNELAVVLTDSFGGWGLQARLKDRAGLTIEAR